MKPLLIAACLSVVFACPAYCGDFFAQTACDSTMSDQTTFTLALYDLHGTGICEVELHPKALGVLPAAPITAWETPPGWTAEPIKGEAGAIVLHGCIQGFFVEGFKITMPGHAGNLGGIAHDHSGNMTHTIDHLFFCGRDPTPAAISTWGKLKSLYR